MELDEFKGFIKGDFKRSLPKELRVNGLGQVDIHLTKIAVDSDKCIDAHVAGSDENDTRYYLLVSKECLRQNEVTLKKSLLREIIRAVWKQNKHGYYNNQKLVDLIYQNNFYYLNWEFGLNLNQRIEKILDDFWEICFLEMVYGDRFSGKYPALVSMLELLFDGSKVTNTNGAVIQQNRAKVAMIEGANEAFYARYDLIKQAKKSIHVQYFSWFDDVFGNSLLELLRQKASEGVNVYLMLDSKGHSVKMSVLKCLVSFGVQVRLFNKFSVGSLVDIRRYLQAGFIDSFVASNHDKMLLVDEKFLIVGGRNIGTRYFVVPSESKEKVYDDLDVYAEFERPASSVLKAFSLEFWNDISTEVSAESFKSTSPIFRDVLASLKSNLVAVEERMDSEAMSKESLDSYPELENYKSINGYKKWRWPALSDYVPITGIDNSSAFAQIDHINRNVLLEMDNAKESIYIQNPYFTFTTEFEQHLRKAAQRGVEIYISVPSILTTDIYITLGPLMHRWRYYVENFKNVHIYGYTGKGDLHTKVFVFDRQRVIVGSYNLDHLSSYVNSEFTLAIDSINMAEEIIKKIDQTIDTESIPFTLESDGPMIHGNRNLKINSLLLLSLILFPWI